MGRQRENHQKKQYSGAYSPPFTLTNLNLIGHTFVASLAWGVLRGSLSLGSAVEWRPTWHPTVRGSKGQGVWWKQVPARLILSLQELRMCFAQAPPTMSICSPLVLSTILVKIMSRLDTLIRFFTCEASIPPLTPRCAQRHQHTQPFHPGTVFFWILAMTEAHSQAPSPWLDCRHKRGRLALHVCQGRIEAAGHAAIPGNGPHTREWHARATSR